MNPESNPPAGTPELREERFSLRELLREVDAERRTGAFGAEKLRQKDISKLFDANPGSSPSRDA